MKIILTIIKQGELFPDVIEIDGDKMLSVTKKSSILTNGIFGVDIDSQAVEVTMMSLYLKILEGAKSLPEKKGILPSLSSNIKCGNSLINYDYLYDKQKLNLNYENDEEEKENINPFDWKSHVQGFGKILDNGGFDCVIGNPPWGACFSDNENIYVKNEYRKIIVRMTDSFMYFVYKSFQILNKKGTFGMILPDVILYQNDNKLLRQYLTQNSALSIVINLGNDIFEKVIRPSCIVIFDKKTLKTNKISIGDLSTTKKNEKVQVLQKNILSTVEQKIYDKLPNTLYITKNIEDYKIYNKIIDRTDIVPLKTFIDEDGIQRGVSPDYKDAFIVTKDIIKKFA
jgi:hypothetical protein